MKFMSCIFDKLKIGGLYIVFPVQMIMRDYSHGRNGIVVNQASIDDEILRKNIELSYSSKSIKLGNITTTSYITKNIKDDDSEVLFSYYEPFIVLEKHENYKEKLDKLFILRTNNGDSVMGYIGVYNNDDLYPLVRSEIYEMAASGA